MYYVKSKVIGQFPVISYELPVSYRFALPAGVAFAGVATDGLAAGVAAGLVAALEFATGFTPAFAFVFSAEGVGVVTLPAWFELAAFAGGAGRAPLSSFGLSTTFLAR